jgi:TfdA family taurine catabolism dioxygenase TauD
MDEILPLGTKEVPVGDEWHAHFTEAFYARAAGKILVQLGDTADSHRRNLDVATAVISHLGEIVDIYPGAGLWSDLGVELTAEPHRTHGVGENPLHVDLIDRAKPPRFIALYCQRNDPMGGGASLLADMWGAAAMLGSEAKEILRSRIFRYWTDVGVHGVGKPLPAFSVLPKNIMAGVPIRFSTKMLPHVLSGDVISDCYSDRERVLDALNHFERLLSCLATSVLLKPGQLLIFDQFRYAHGRAPLGPNQGDLDPSKTRLLKQAYAKDRSADGDLDA